jgi:hypothetical protein
MLQFTHQNEVASHSRPVELRGRNAERLAKEQPVALGHADPTAFPSADFGDQGVVARHRFTEGTGGLPELAGHLGHVPATGLPLLPKKAT